MLLTLQQVVLAAALCLRADLLFYFVWVYARTVLVAVCLLVVGLAVALRTANLTIIHSVVGSNAVQLDRHRSRTLVFAPVHILLLLIQVAVPSGAPNRVWILEVRVIIQRRQLSRPQLQYVAAAQRVCVAILIILRISSIYQLSLWTELDGPVELASIDAFVVALSRPLHFTFLGTIRVEGGAHAITLVGVGHLFGSLVGIETNGCICFKFVDQLVYLLYVNLSRVVLVEHFKHLLVLLSIQIKLILLRVTVTKYLRTTIWLRLLLILLYF